MSAKQKLIFFTGGGTAGHVTPNIALIEKLAKENWRIEYVGSKNGIEKSLIKPLGIPFHSISSGKLRRYFSWQNFIDPIFIILGILQSLFLCLRHRPNIIFSKGGFVAVPLVFSAWICRIPVICHESDITPGLANKLCFPFSKIVCLNFPQSQKYLPSGKTRVTGTPIRKSLLQGDKVSGLSFLEFKSSNENKKVLLVFGGSLGAEAINTVVREALPKLVERYLVVHIVGKGNLDSDLSNSAYRQFEYLQDEFGDVLAASDYVVSRAGANAIYELLVTAKPHILIPLSKKASRGDQIINARIFKEEGVSLVIDEAALTATVLLEHLNSLSDQAPFIREKLAAYASKDAQEIISGLINETARS